MKLNLILNLSEKCGKTTKVNGGGDDRLIFGGATSGSHVNGGFGLESIGEHLHGLGLPMVIFADIRIDERRWPWPWMLSSIDENVEVLKPGYVTIDLPWFAPEEEVTSRSSNIRCFFQSKISQLLNKFKEYNPFSNSDQLYPLRYSDGC